MLTQPEFTTDPADGYPSIEGYSQPEVHLSTCPSSSSYTPCYPSVPPLLRPALTALSCAPGASIIGRFGTAAYNGNAINCLLQLICVYYISRHFIRAAWIARTKPKPMPESDVAVLSDPSPTGPTCTLTSGQIAINLSSLDCFSLAESEDLRQNSVKTLRRYGVGPCGPSGFYGTQDVHIQLEKALAKHMGVESAIIYAQYFATMTSVIPAFCKKGDIIVADCAVSFPILKGVQISRSRVYWYRHNDLDHLHQVLAAITEKERDGPLTRRFLVTESLFSQSGSVTDLARLVALKDQYRFRFILDEGNTFGLFGNTGRGLTEEQNVDPASIDIIVGSLAGQLCSAGGFCVGSRLIVEHQRINSSGYTYSASLPALLATSSIFLLQSFFSSPAFEEGSVRLRQKIGLFRQLMDTHSQFGYCVKSSPLNPTVLIGLNAELVQSQRWTNHRLDCLIQKMVLKCRLQGVIVGRNGCPPNPPESTLHDLIPSSIIAWRPIPAIRVRIQAALEDRHIQHAARVICHAIREAVMGAVE